MKNNLLFPILAMAAVVVTSNILVQFFFGDWLTLGAFTYPFAFLVNDVTNRRHGPQAAQRVVFWGFVTGVVCSLIGTQVVVQIASDFAAPAVTLRIALGSGIAFLVAHLTNIGVFQAVHESNKEKSWAWYRAPLTSSLWGAALDTFLFFGIAFSATMTSMLGADHNTDFFNEEVMTPFGVEMIRWHGTACIDFLCKMALVLIALAPFRILTRKAQAT